MEAQVAALNGTANVNGNGNGVHPVNPRKRRRRRRLDRPAISARLLVDERLRGEVGVLSEDLYEDLFGKGGG